MKLTKAQREHLTTARDGWYSPGRNHPTLRWLERKKLVAECRYGTDSHWVATPAGLAALKGSGNGD